MPLSRSLAARRLPSIRRSRRRRCGDAGGESELVGSGAARPPLDVEVETNACWRGRRAATAAPAEDAELRAEVRQLVVTQRTADAEGLEPLDVEAETERRLADLVGSA